MENTGPIPSRDEGRLQKRYRMWLRLAIISSALLLLVQILRWPLVSLLTVFMEPMLEGALWIFFLIVTVCVLGTAFYRWKNPTRQVILALVICLASAIIIWSVPFNRIYLSANFHFFKTRRTTLAQQALAGRFEVVQAGGPGGSGDLLKLPATDHLLSDDGEIVVDHREGKDFVLFFTFRGILDRFSGFVYSPTDTPPAKDEFLGDGREVERLAPNWYWYAS